MPKDKKGIQHRQATIARSAVNEEERTVQVSFSSEARVDRWYGVEILGHGEGEVDLSRLEELGVALWNHNPDAPVGSIERVWIGDDRRGHAVIRFDDDEESDKVFRKILSGTIKGISVGYRVSRWEIVHSGEVSACGRFEGPCEVARKWEPFEISPVSVPADPQVGVGRSHENNEEDDKRMEKGKQTKVQEPERGQEPEKPRDFESELERAQSAERERVAEILGMCSRFEVDATDFIRNGNSPDEVRRAVLEKLSQERQEVNIPNVEVGRESRESFREAARDGVCMRAGITVEKPTEGAEDFRGMSLRELARESLVRAGENGRGNPMEMVGRALVSSDLPVLLGSAAELSLMAGWDSLPESWKEWVDDSGSVSDFKIHTMARPGELGDLEHIPEEGEYKYGKRSETFEQYQVKKYGKMFSITREAIINDDLSAMTDIPRQHGEATSRLLGDLAYAALTGNPTMGDGKALFHTGHGNLLSGANAVPLSYEDFEATLKGFEDAIMAMRLQKDIGGKRRLNIQPEFLIVPVALAMTARRFFAEEKAPLSVTLDTGTSKAFGGGANPLRNQFQIVSDPRLDDDSQAAWYLAARKGQTVKMFYLNGQRTPYMEQRQGWNRDGVEYKVRIEVGAKPVDWRGLLKNMGA